MLDRLMAEALAGRSQVLVLRGEAGVGKTALLTELAQRAHGCRVVRATGAESEMELAFAGLHQLCAPMLDGLEGLPGPQRDALATAFGLSAGHPPDRFLVGLAALSLLSDAAERQPLLCLVDDVQWLDRVSAQTLAFVARRLLAERVAMVFAVREGDGNQELAGLPAFVVEGLRDRHARELLDSAIPGRMDERVRDRIVAETRGNPLALLELPRALTAEQLAGGFALPNALPLAGRMEQSFLRRVRSLPARTQRLLLIAAAEPVDDVPLLLRAAERLGIGPEAAAPAEAAGLFELGARVLFRHPLVRSAAYRAAGSEERQDVHRALAEATDPSVDPDHRAWHRAHAAVGLDEAVASELERSADRAQGRGGAAAAAAFLEKAAALTPDPARRVARTLAAAQAKFKAGAPDAADELLATVEVGPSEELERAQVARLRAQIVFARIRGSDAAPLLLDAARRLEPLDSGLARETHLEALGAVIFAGRLGGRPELREAAEAARAAPEPRERRLTDLLLEGVATRFTEGYAAGMPPLRRALQAFRREAGRGDGDVMRWLWLACPVAPEPVAPELWDYETWCELATRAVRLARDAGALTVLPVALSYRAGVHVHAGEFTTAAALIEEADAIGRATGNAPLRYTSLMLVAWRGDEGLALRTIEAAVGDATARGEGRALGLAGYAAALLHNGHGRYGVALAHARQACSYEDLGFFGWALVELIEAAARSGDTEAAASALHRLEGRCRAAATDWSLGILARSSALLSDGQTAERLYREAVERLGRSQIVPQLARAHQLYGEWLRRENRRIEAREQLRTSHDMFSRIGAEAFAERARRELMATGETVRTRTPRTRADLTAQEAQIARLAGDGLTNPEIGARLFLSPRTVEWHLHKVFTKLDVSSRRELRETLPDAFAVAEPA
jgi:DNA-binding CsgD family transcriptional regulator/tetratricopeptide (TPR) repeat protein